MADERIDLSEDWYMELDGSTRENGERQGFVFRPDGKDSASLTAARGLGHLTGNFETKIPPNVMEDISRSEYDDYE